MRRVYATLGSLAFVFALAIGAHAQVPPAVTPTATPLPRPAPPTPPAPGPAQSSSPVPSPPVEPGAPALPGTEPGSVPTPAASAPASPNPGPVASPDTTPAAGAEPAPSPSPTPVPIIADPPSPSVEPGKVIQVRLSGTYGTIVAVSANAQVADVVADQNQRALFITGRGVGTTTISVKDDRGDITRDIPVRVAYAAGRGICLQADRGVFTTYKAVVFDAAFKPAALEIVP